MTKARFGNHPDNRKKKALQATQELEKIKSQENESQRDVFRSSDSENIVSKVSLNKKTTSEPNYDEQEATLKQRKDSNADSLVDEATQESRSASSNTSESSNDLLSFVSSKTKKKEEVGMKQVILRVPIPLWKKVVKLKGTTSNQGLLLSLLEYYVDQKTKNR